MSTSTSRSVPAVSSTSASHAATGSRKILLVEDSDTTRLTHRILITKRTQHAVISVANGVDALKMAELEKPDLILMDIVMPGMDGLEVCQRLRQQPATTNVPIVLLTFRMEDESKAEGYASGCTDFVKKPLSGDALVDVLKKHLGA